MISLQAHELSLFSSLLNKIYKRWQTIDTIEFNSCNNFTLMIGGSTGHRNTAEIFCVGNKKFNVLSERPFNSSAILSSCSYELTDRSVFLGIFWRSRLFVFSLVPFCQGDLGSRH
jgi:hypothetical protein